MKRVIMVLSLIMFILLIIVNIIYAGREHSKLLNESHVLEQKVNELEINNEIIIGSMHENFTSKNKFIHTVDSLHTEIVYKDSVLDMAIKNISRLKSKNSILTTIYNDTLKNDTILFNE
jgi:hypothetical protein